VTVALDVVSNVSAGTGDRSWTHTPSGTPRAAIVLTSQYEDGTDQVDANSYGALALDLVGQLLKTSVEPAAVYAYFKGSGIPTGAQTVLVDTPGAGASKRAVAITLTAAADCEVVDWDVLQSDSITNPSVTLQIPTGRTAFVCGVNFSGAGAVTGVNPAADCTELLEYDAGNMVASFIRLTTNPTGGDATIGWTQTSEDCCIIALAVAEVSLLITETDTVSVVTKSVNQTVGAITGDGTIASVTKSVNQTVGAITETDTLNAVTKSVNVPVAGISGTGTLSGVSKLVNVTVALVSGTGTVAAVAQAKNLTVGVLSEQGMLAGLTLVGMLSEVGTVYALIIPRPAILAAQLYRRTQTGRLTKGLLLGTLRRAT